MIENIKGGIEITHGAYWSRIEDFPVGKEKFKKFQEYEKDLYFVKSPRIKMYLLIKMIKGNTIEEAINKVFDKVMLYDPDYRNLIY